VGDTLYPEITTKREGGPEMQLLASRLAFIDPLSGVSRSFTSNRTISTLP
jgi:hypothetical protein